MMKKTAVVESWQGVQWEALEAAGDHTAVGKVTSHFFKESSEICITISSCYHREEVPPLNSALIERSWRGGKQPGRWSPGGWRSCGGREGGVKLDQQKNMISSISAFSEMWRTLGQKPRTLHF